MPTTDLTCGHRPTLGTGSLLPPCGIGLSGLQSYCGIGLSDLAAISLVLYWGL